MKVIKFKDFILEATEENIKAEEEQNAFKTFIYGLCRFISNNGSTAFLGAALLKLNLVLLSSKNKDDIDIINQVWGSVNNATMAVDDRGNVYISKEFIQKIGKQQTMGVLCHEAMHIITFSLSRFLNLPSNRNIQIWNYATDAVINRDLIELGHLSLPDMGIIPKEGKIVFGTQPVNVSDRSAEQVYWDLFEIYQKQPKQPKQPKKSQPSKDEKLKVGDIVRNKDTGEFGQITKINGNQIEIKTLTRDEVEKRVV